MLMRGKLEICLVWGKLEIKFPLRKKETEAIMVLRFITVIDNLLLTNVLSMLQSREYSSLQFALATDPRTNFFGIFKSFKY